jgi:hypothetical protein
MGNTNNTTLLRRALSVIFAVLLVSAFVYSAIDIQKAKAFSGGDGSSEFPYQIASWQDLDNVRNDLSAHYILVGDLDTSDTGYDTYAGSAAHSGAGWVPIGDNNTKFTGSFDGNDHTVSGLVVARFGTSYVGLFGYLSSTASVQDVTIKNPSFSGNANVGGLSGYSDGAVSGVHIVNPSVSSVAENAGGIAGKANGNITLSSVDGGSVASGTAWGGGITGWQAGGTISRSWTNTAVSGLNDVGGIVGYGQNAYINDCYAAGNVSSPSNSENSFGGLAGVGGTITNSYATGDVTIAGSGENSGGLFGEGGATIRNDFAVGTVTSTFPFGGFVGYNSATITNSYSVFGTPVGNGSSTGVADVVSGDVFKGLNHDHAVYNNPGTEWNFDTIWEAHADAYPTLRGNAPDLPLAMSSLSPADGATNVEADTTLRLVFNKPVVVGTGQILIKRSSNDAVAASIDVTSSAVVGSGTNTIDITLPQPLRHNLQYYVQVPATAFVDESNNSYAGILDATSWNFTVTDDSDGINQATEASAPNTGDANNDGIVDSQQSNVASLPNTVTGHYVSVEVDYTCNLSSVSSLNAADVANDSDYSYPLGLLDFTISCSGAPGFNTTVTQYFYNPPSSTFVLRKLVSSNYTTVSGASISRATIDGQDVVVIRYDVADGGPLDDDKTANGEIIDPAGPAVLAVTSTPTPTPTLTPTPISSTSPTPTPQGILPATGAAVIWYGLIGIMMALCGIGLFQFGASQKILRHK